jgi:hypothetical protein
VWLSGLAALFVWQWGWMWGATESYWKCLVKLNSSTMVGRQNLQAKTLT